MIWMQMKRSQQLCNASFEEDKHESFVQDIENYTWPEALIIPDMECNIPFNYGLSNCGTACQTMACHD